MGLGDGLSRSAGGVCEDVIWNRWVERDLIHRGRCRKHTVTLGTFKVVFYVIVLDSRQQVATVHVKDWKPDPFPLLS